MYFLQNLAFNDYERITAPWFSVIYNPPCAKVSKVYSNKYLNTSKIENMLISA